MTDAASGRTGIQVTYGGLFLWWPWMWGLWLMGAIIPFFFNPKIEVDGESRDGKRDADANFIATTPGQHEVKAHYRQGFIKLGGRSSTTVNVPAGQVLQLKYRAPLFAIAFLGGSLSAV